VIGVGSGFDALRLALQALAIGPGDEVILPANTYIATALAVSAAGARPVLVDCLPDTFAVDPDLIDAAVTSNTRAIIPVHLTGQAAPMEPIAHIAARHSLHVIEDAAQAHGTAYMGAMCGSLGEIGCFSFYPGKNLGGYGDGGAVATNDHHLAERLRELRNYGQHAKYYHVVKGFNSRLDSIQAAVLKVKLAKLSEWNEQRAHNATLYHELLRGVGDVAFQRQASESTHNYHLFIVTTAYRDLLRNHLGAAGIETGIHYPLPIHLQPAYADLNYIHGQFPQAERLAKEMLSLPMYPELLPSEINYVAYSIKDFFARLEGLVP
jgi:dTDP-4-amino-4,6-dideoxygalactose transaminase